MIDLKTYEFEPARMALATDKKLLAEADERGFLHRDTKYSKLFSALFFNGGQVIFKEDVPPEIRDRIWTYCRSFMKSFEPKHEHKEAICAMLMSEIIKDIIAAPKSSNP